MRCAACDTVLPPTTTRPRKFCAAACRNRHHRKQNKDEGRNAWFSPPDVVEAARRVMGGIDLDPASCKPANQIVRATRYYTRADDGLLQPWRGRVWLNPPYDKLAPKFFVKFCEEHAAGHVPMACLLLGTHHLTTKWFQRSRDFPTIICIPAGRLRFTGYRTTTQPTHGSAILGAGVDSGVFRREFADLGTIMEAGV